MNRLPLCASLLLASATCLAELQALGDEDLSAISGQAGGGFGVDIDLQGVFEEISYFDDGSQLILEGIRFGAADDINQSARQTILFNVDGTSFINLDIETEKTRFQIDSIRTGNSGVNSFGTLAFDYQVAGKVNFRPSPAGDNRFFQINADLSFTDSDFQYIDDGSAFIADGVNYDLFVQDLEVSLFDRRLTIDVPVYRGSFSVDAFRFNNGNTVAAGTVDGSLPSFGGIAGDFDVESRYEVLVGGRLGAQGVTINQQTTVNDATLSFLNDESFISFDQVSGEYSYENYTFDLAQNADGLQGINLAFDRLEGQFTVGRFLGGNINAPRPFGSLNVDFLFADQVVDGRTYSNRTFLTPGGDPNAGTNGITLDNEFSLVDANFRYTDDGRTVILSGINAFGGGIVNVDLTRAGTVGSTPSFDGIRFGFVDYEVNYSIDGLRVGDDSAPLQGGSELLLALEIFPAYDFTLNGQVTVGAGGADGEGLTINADVVLSDATAAITTDENDFGIFATGINFDVQLRDVTVDITDDGIAIVQGERWSTMDISDLRVGDRVGGRSFGRFVLSRFERGSSVVIGPGGAGDVCIGASASTEAGCLAAGGRFEARGEEGLSIDLRNIFVPAEGDRRNQFIYETDRQIGPNGPINGSGLQLVVDNFSTNDGVDGQNTFGILNELDVDVFETRVTDRSTGAQSFPLGFAVRARTQFKEIDVDNINLVHPTGGSQTIVYGLKLQNFDITSNLTATPVE